MADHNAIGWVVVKPVFTQYGALREVKLDRITQNRPQALGNGERAFRLTVTLPSSIFDPFALVDITVPEGALLEPEVVVGEP